MMKEDTWGDGWGDGWLKDSIDTFIYNYHGDISQPEIDEKREELLRQEPYSSVYMNLIDVPLDIIFELEKENDKLNEKIETQEARIKQLETALLEADKGMSSASHDAIDWDDCTDKIDQTRESISKLVNKIKKCRLTDDK